jgi:hypothetical protein
MRHMLLMSCIMNPFKTIHEIPFQRRFVLYWIDTNQNENFPVAFSIDLSNTKYHRIEVGLIASKDGLKLLLMRSFYAHKDRITLHNSKFRKKVKI